MIFILKDIGKGKIGIGERQITSDNLFRLDNDTTSDTNYFVNTATFSDGFLTLTRNEGTSIRIPMDGRYLQSFTEQDPTVPQHVKNITLNNLANWNNGYYDDITSMSLSRSANDLIVTMFKRNGDTMSQQIKVSPTNITEIANRSYTDLQNLPTLNSTNWNTAYGWGNHAIQGYITGINNITQIPSRSYYDLQDLPDINNTVSVINTNNNIETHEISIISGDSVLETVTKLNDPTLNGNVLTLRFLNENGVEQSVTVDLSTIVANSSGVNNATYSAASNIITLTEVDGDVWEIDLSEFSILTTTNEFGVTFLEQEGVTKLTVSKVGQSGEFADLLNKPTTVAGYGINNTYTKIEIGDILNAITPIAGYNKSNWDIAFAWGDHALMGYLTDYQSLVWNSTLGDLSISNGNTVNLDGRYAKLSQLQPFAFNGLSIQNGQGVEQFVSSDHLKFEGVAFDPETKTIIVEPVPPQTLTWNGKTSGNLSISDGNTVDLDDRYSKSPDGAEGQLYYIDEHGTNNIEPDYPVKRGIVVENQEEFDIAAIDGFSLEEVFNRWKMFSHYFGTIEEEQSPPTFPALNESDPQESTRLTADEFYTKSAWGYDDVNERIYLTKNYNPYTGFISPKKYSNYTLEATLSSINNDDDQIGLIIGFYKDPITGFEHTLSVIRTLHQLSGQGNYSYVVTYNYGQNLTTSPNYNPTYASNSEQILVDGTATAPVPAGATGWVGNNTRLRVERVNNVMAIKTSQFGGSIIDDATLITLDLSTFPQLSMFMGSSEIGFSARSQKDAYFSNITFTGFVDYIFWDKENNTYETWEYNPDSSTYFLQSPKTLTAKEYFGISRFIHSYLFSKTYYINENDVLIKIGDGSQTKEQIDAHIADLNNPHQVTAEQLNLGNVDNTPDIDKIVSIPQQTEITRVENLIPQITEEEIINWNNPEDLSPSTILRTVYINEYDLTTVDEQGVQQYLSQQGITIAKGEIILLHVEKISSYVLGGYVAPGYVR